MRIFTITMLTVLMLSGTIGYAEKDEVEMQTTFIRGNKELPQILFIVPWRDLKKERRKEQTIVLHSLFGDLFDPVDLTQTYQSDK